jgi:hypothetical protein
MGRIREVTVTVLLALGVSGCGLIDPTLVSPLSAEETSYIEDCEIVERNFESYAQIQERISSQWKESESLDWIHWSEGASILNSGGSSRGGASESISKEFPWVMDSVDKYFSGMPESDFLEHSSDLWVSIMEQQIYEDFFIHISSGTDLRFDSDEFIELAEREYSGYVEGITFYDYLGELSPTSRFSDCESALSIESETNLAERFEEVGINGETGARVKQAYGVAIELWGCEKYGAGIVFGDIEECADSDYVEDSPGLCIGKLETTPSSAEPGECGNLDFEVFQADTNTGDCMALGWWVDANGVQQVGAFRFCGLSAGYAYSETVSVGRDFTYVNNFGVEKTVLTFTQSD